MAQALQSVRENALSLSTSERAALVLELLDSMDIVAPGESPAEIERVWLAESDRRYQAYLAGEESAVSAEDVFADYRDGPG